MSNLGLSGKYKIEVIRENGTKEVLVDWFDNMILDSGLNRLGTGGIFGYMALGSDSTPAVSTQTGLISSVVTTNSYLPDTSGAQSTPPYYSWRRVSYRFPVRANPMTVSEVGIGWSTTNMFSRALILAGGSSAVVTATTTSNSNILNVTSVTSGSIILGSVVIGTNIPTNTVITQFLTGTGGVGTYTMSTTMAGGAGLVGITVTSTVAGVPTSLTIQPTEILDVTYEIRVYKSETPILGQIILGGQTYYTKLIPASLTSNGATYFGDYAMGWQQALLYMYCYNGTIGSITSLPSGTFASFSSKSPAAYSNNSYTFSGTVYCDVNSANLVGGIKAFTIGCTSAQSPALSVVGTWQVGFFEPDYTTPKAIPKTTNDTLSFTVSVSWARRDPV